SSGFHSNGYSLIRKVVFEYAGLSVDDRVEELDATVGDVLLTPTRIYADVVGALMRDEQISSSVTGIAHITGGGLIENTQRVLPAGCHADIDLASLSVPPVFTWLQQLGDIATDEMWRVFNMGIGLCVIVRPEAAEQPRTLIDACCPGIAQLGSVAAE